MRAALERSKTVKTEARHKTVKTEARHKTVKARYKTVTARQSDYGGLFQLQVLEICASCCIFARRQLLALERRRAQDETDLRTVRPN